MARSDVYAYDVMFCFGFYSYHNKFYNHYQHHLSLGILLHYHYQTNEKSINRYTIIATKGGINLLPPLHWSLLTTIFEAFWSQHTLKITRSWHHHWRLAHFGVGIICGAVLNIMAMSNERQVTYFC